MKLFKVFIIVVFVGLFATFGLLYSKNSQDIDRFDRFFGTVFDGRKLVNCENFRTDYYQDCFKVSLESFLKQTKNLMGLRAYFLALKVLSHKDAIKLPELTEGQLREGDPEKKQSIVLFNFIDATGVIQKSMGVRTSRDRINLWTDDLIETWFYIQLSNRYHKAALDVEGSLYVQDDEDRRAWIKQTTQQFDKNLDKRLISNKILKSFLSSKQD